MPKEVTWMEEIRNPNEPKRKRKKNKLSECIPDYLPNNMPVAHTTIVGRGRVGRLIKKWKRK
jgi:hypothetical protein